MNLAEQKTVAILALSFELDALEQEAWQRVADRLAERLGHPALVLSLHSTETAAESIEDMMAWYASQAYTRMVFIGISLSVLNWTAVYSALTWSNSQSLSVYLSKPWGIGDWSDALAPPAFETFAGGGAYSDEQRQDNLILFVASGSNPEVDRGGEVSLLTHHFKQYAESADVQYSFVTNLRPRLTHLLDHYLWNKATNLLLLPWRLSDQEFEQCCVLAGMQDSSSEIVRTSPLVGRYKHHAARSVQTVDLLSHVAIVHVLVDKYLETLSEQAIRVPAAGSLTADGSTISDEATMRQLDELNSRIDTMLPSEYRGRTDEVSPKSMGSASLAFDEHGRVAWDKIWTSFCDLALAGGPPHRGKLLEAVGREEVTANLAAYQSVAQEIRRGIELVTGLSTQESPTLGWIGVVSESEAMAVWLLRAIIVENVMVRREGSVLFLPAGPDFTLKREIKNVITSVAKTVHYWRAHLGHTGKQLT